MRVLLEHQRLLAGAGVDHHLVAERLRELVDAGLLTRTAYNEIPPRVDYAPTEKATAMEPASATLTE